MNVVVGSPNLDQGTLVRSDDSANVLINLLLVLGLDRRFSEFCAENDVIG